MEFFKPGDRVRVYDWPQIKPSSEGAHFYTSMYPYVGEIVTIEKIDMFGAFTVKENSWIWSTSHAELAVNSKQTQAESVLTEALRIAGVDRSRDYGHPFDNHDKIARLWSVILDVEVTAEQVALCMILLKAARENNKSKRDNLVDIGGYTRCLELIIEERAKRGAK